MNCIMNAFDLFKTNSCQATTLAALAFVAGAVIAVVACRLFGPCGRKCSSAPMQRRDRMRRSDDRPFEKRKPHPAPADGSVEIYVGNLSYEMSEEQLRAEFAKFGTVSTVRLVVNKFNGKSKGFGFVQMPVRAEAEKACAALNDSEIMGRRIKCNEAKNLV